MIAGQLHLVGDLAGIAGQPLVGPPLTFYVGVQGGATVPFSGKTGRFVLRSAAGADVLSLNTGNDGVTLGDIDGTARWDSRAITHDPLVAGKYSYAFEIYSAAGLIEISLTGQYEIREALT